ncbi:hypothetical protein Bca52824_092108 [Brassica carinata]|uniref:Uncharacterized protein n=1 Tax=Brassica carinata TaxID=52824 RepID=A0A8X7NU12_BRACI|nr:hypothetical protein Bca52824_092108 [Brassica carinata]
MSIAFTQELSGQNPWIKMGLTIFFAILMALHEHRAKLKRNKMTAPNRLTVAWIFNSGYQYRLPYHPHPDYSAFPPPALPAPPPPDLLPIYSHNNK